MAESDKSNDNPLYIFIHGWGNSHKDWAEDMADLISGNPQILFLDWSEIAKKDGIEFAPYYEATWIDVVANEAATALKIWGIKNNNATIIGHSLGTLLGTELAVRLEGVTSANNLSDINLIMLDPAASVGGYEIDTKGTEFAGFGYNGLCIVADDSIPGSETLMKTCDKKFLIEYDDPVNNSVIDDYVDFTVDEIKDTNIITTAYKMLKGSIVDFIVKKIAVNTGKYAYGEVTNSITQHNWVHETYREIIRHPFYDNILSPVNLAASTTLELQNGDINGVIYTEKDQSTKIKYLKTIQNKYELDDRYSLFGNTQSNAFECNENMECVMYTSDGSDIINQTEYAKSIYVADFDKKNDKVILQMHGLQYLIETPSVTDESWYESGSDNIGIIPLMGRQVALEGVSFDEVEGWVDTALNGTEEANEENPIIILNNV